MKPCFQCSGLGPGPELDSTQVVSPLVHGQAVQGPALLQNYVQSLQPAVRPGQNMM